MNLFGHNTLAYGEPLESIDFTGFLVLRRKDGRIRRNTKEKNTRK